MESVKKFIKNAVCSIFTKWIISILTPLIGLSIGLAFKFQQNQINKLQQHFGSQHKDLTINFVINNNDLHKDLLQKLKQHCNDGVYLSYFSSDDNKGTWVALVSNHEILTQQARFLATHLDTLTKDPIQLEALHNLANVAFLAENIIKRQDFNPIYTQTYKFALGGIDPTSQSYFYNLPYFQPQIITKQEIENYNFLRYIFGHIMLAKHNISSEAQVYIYSLYKPEINRIRFITLFFTNTNNNCVDTAKMQKLLSDTYQILNKYNV